ncbi:hypothetical protein BZA05DRAFT_406253 [Tricharina praecox]|uniref:uncharacterized protein n=1 Tax=Tricharina praecox TaxID=43433 RepID=UPI0022207106|nr:uncharacterized protein BZA05DRAFT_406253 [Tricharina praecox]KAI5846670.1 hypothetical protein BZA05DRAFT_406253 [Tricharina praecox]
MLPSGVEVSQQRHHEQQRQDIRQTASTVGLDTRRDHSRPSSSSRVELTQQHKLEQRREQQHQDLQESEHSAEERSDHEEQEEQLREGTTEGGEAFTALGLRGGYLHSRDRDENEYKFAERTKKGKKEKKEKHRENGSAIKEVSHQRSSSSHRNVESGASASEGRTQEQQRPGTTPVQSYAQAIRGRVSTQGAIQGHQSDTYHETSGQQIATERPPHVSQASESGATRARYDQTTGTLPYVAMPSPTTGGYISQPATPVEQWTSGGHLANVGAPPLGAELSQTKSEQFSSSQPAVQEWEAQQAQVEKTQHQQRYQGAEIEHHTALPVETTQESYSSQSAVEEWASGQQASAKQYNQTVDAAQNAQSEHRQETQTLAVIPASATGGYISQPASAVEQWTSGGYLAHTGVENRAVEPQERHQDTIQSSQPAISEWNQRTHHQVAETSQTTSEARYEQATGTAAFVPMPVPATGYISQPATPVEQWTAGGYLANTGFELHSAQSVQDQRERTQPVDVAASLQSSQPAVAEWNARQAALRHTKSEQYEHHQTMESPAFVPLPAEATQSYTSQSAVHESEARRSAVNAQAIQHRIEQTTGTSEHTDMPMPTTGGYISQPATPSYEWTSGGYLANAGAELPYIPLQTTETEEYERRQDNAREDVVTRVQAERSYSSQPAVQEWEAKQAENRAAQFAEGLSERNQSTETLTVMPAPAQTTGGYITQPAATTEQLTLGGYLTNAGAELTYNTAVETTESYSSQPAVAEWEAKQAAIRATQFAQGLSERHQSTETSAVVPAPAQMTGGYISQPATPSEEWTSGGYLANAGVELAYNAPVQTAESYSSQPAVQEWEAKQAAIRAAQFAEGLSERNQSTETLTVMPAPTQTTGGYITQPTTTTEQLALGGYLANAGVSSSQPAVQEWEAEQAAIRAAQFAQGLSERYQSTETSVAMPAPTQTTGGYISQPATPSEEWTSGGYLASAGAELPYVPQPAALEYERHQDTTPAQGGRIPNSSTAVEEWNVRQSHDVQADQSQHEQRQHSEAVPVRPRPTQSYSSQPAVIEWEARQQRYADRSQSQTQQYIADETDQKTPRQYPADIQMPSSTAMMHTSPLTTPVEEYTTSEPGWGASIPLSFSQPNSEVSNTPSRRQRRASSAFSDTTTAAESGTTYSVISRGAASTVLTSIDDLEAFECRRESKREYDDSTDSDSDGELSGEDVEGASLAEGQQTAQGEEGPKLGLRGGDAGQGRRRHRTKEEKAASKKRREARREERRLREEQGEGKQQVRRKISRSQTEVVDSTSKPTKETPKQSGGDGSWSRFLGKFVSPAPTTAAVAVAATKASSLRRVKSGSEKSLKKSTSDMSLSDKLDSKIQLQRDSSTESWQGVQKDGEEKTKKKRRNRESSVSSDVGDTTSAERTPGRVRSASGTVTLAEDLDGLIAKLKIERTEEEQKSLGLRGGELRDEGKKNKKMDILTYLEEKEKLQERKKKKALKEKERAERERKREKKERRKMRKEEQKKAGEAVEESSSEEEQEGVKLDDNGAAELVEDLSESDIDEASYVQAKQQPGNNGVVLPGVQIGIQPEHMEEEEEEGSMAKKAMKIADEKKVKKLSDATATAPSSLHEDDFALVAGRKQEVAGNRSGRKEEKKAAVQGKLRGGDRLSDVEEEQEGGKFSHVLDFVPVSSIKSAGSYYVSSSSTLPGDLPSVRFSLPGETQPVLPGQSPALQKPSEVVLPEGKPDVLKSSSVFPLC